MGWYQPPLPRPPTDSGYTPGTYKEKAGGSRWIRPSLPTSWEGSPCSPNQQGNPIDSIDLSTTGNPQFEDPNSHPCVLFYLLSMCSLLWPWRLKRDVWLDVLLRCARRSPQGFVGWSYIHPFIWGKWLGGKPYKPWTYGEVFVLPQTKKSTRPEGWSCWNFVNKKLNWKERPSFFFGRGGFLDWMIL